MHVLITRPYDDGVALKTQLESRNIASTLAPTLTLSFETLADLDLAGVRAIVVTSRNGLRSLEHNRLIDHLSGHRLYTVGSATADYAHALGFRSVRIGPGTAEGLSKQIVEECDPANGAIIHIAGAHLAFDLKQSLEASGFEVREMTAYRAEPVQRFPESALSALNAKTVNAVILMSARSATAYATLVEHHALAQTISGLHYFCLSSSVQDALVRALPDIKEHCLSVADRPNTEELLALVTRFAAHYSNGR